MPHLLPTPTEGEPDTNGFLAKHRSSVESLKLRIALLEKTVETAMGPKIGSVRVPIAERNRVPQRADRRRPMGLSILVDAKGRARGFD